MTDAEKREAARKFYNKWHEKGKENQDDRSYWIDFLQDVLGVENVTSRVEFQKTVVGPDGNTKFIDAYIPETRVLIEQKSLGIDLSKPQAGHNNMTPYQQAKMYDNSLPVSEKAKWIILSNFAEIWVYDMDVAVPEPEKFLLEQIPHIYNKFEFIVNKEQQQLSHEMEISIKAGEFVGLIYDALSKQYHNIENLESQKSLNVLCVRLVFCLYAEDAHIFGTNSRMFHDYLNGFSTEKMRKALIELFKILNTPEEQRDSYDTSDLMKFPYVNGGLFAKEDIEIPNFTDEIRDILLAKASDGFDWSDISPTIFGAVFESTLNPETRRSGGMHYTSIENIHKVIDPLFLDELKAELDDIKSIQVLNSKKNRLEAFQNKLASLTWLDPAAGSGNFLTETYLSIRKLENQAIRGILDCKKGSVDGQIVLADTTNPIKVNINQFYGIEINDFAVTVAKTALWIAESQMIKETEEIILQQINFLPLKTNANIVEGNALRINWEDVIPKNRLNYIMGNPPFVGGMYMSEAQKNDITELMSDFKNAGELDYVAGWYKKSFEIMENTSVRAALVSTNSICQGQQATTLWAKLIDLGVVINFGYQTFIWDSEAHIKAHVHCIIVGFSLIKSKDCYLFDSKGEKKKVDYINQYLTAAPAAIIESRSNPISDVPPIRFGSMPRDGGGFILSEEEKNELIAKEPLAEQWIRLYLGAEEFLKNKKRYCLWLLGANPSEVAKCPTVKARIQGVKDFRLASKAAGTRKYAETPMLFCQIAQPSSGSYIAVPKTSSERRRYIPLGFLDYMTIASDLLFLIPNASLYNFGVLESNVHMAWMRVVAGRLKSDYRYSKDIVYNNFPWPNPTDSQKIKIESTAQGIIDARKLYSDSSLADLYDPLTMPVELIKAHQANDRAVMEAYGFNVGTMSEEDCVAELMKMYQELTKTES